MIRRVRDEDFDRLFEEHAQPLFGFLVYRTANRQVAEDLLADTFERVLRGRGRFDRRRGSEKTWIYAIALNLLRDQARRQAAEARAHERVATPASGSDDVALGRVEQHDELLQALSSLSGEEREAIALRYGADLTVPEIAKLKREPLTTVEGRVYRALRKLRQDLS